MARHSRDMIRHHRERVIAKRTNLFQAINYTGWVPPHLSKYSAHHHRCYTCSTQEQDSVLPYNWKSDPEVFEYLYGIEDGPFGGRFFMLFNGRG